MDEDKKDPPRSDRPPQPGRRAAPTIDLTATEVPPNAPKAPPGNAPEAPSFKETPGADTASASTARQAQSETLSESCGPEAGADDSGKASERDRAHHERAFPAIPLPALAAGAAGAVLASVIILVVLGGFGFFSQRNVTAELGPRLGAVEQRVQQLRELAGRQVADPRADLMKEAEAAERASHRMQQLETAVAALQATLDKLAFANSDSVQARLGTVEAGVGGLNDRLGELSRKLDETARAAHAARASSESLAATARDLKQGLAAAPTEAAGQKDIEALRGRFAAIEDAMQRLRSEVGAASKAAAADAVVRRAVAAEALRAVVERAAPFSVELSALKALGADPAAVAALEPLAASGLPSAAALQREFGPASQAILAVAGAGRGDGDVLERLKAGAERLVRIRPTTEVAGEEPNAIVARAEAQLGRGDVAAALSELKRLSPTLQQPAAAWMQRAQARTEAIETVRRLATEAMRAMARTAS